MVQPALYEICQLGQATLYMMPKPSGETLAEDIAHYHAKGVNKVVSLLLPEEAQAQGLATEEAECLAKGIAFESFPVKDMDVPSLVDLQRLNARLKKEMDVGVSVAIHCYGGRGRAGTVAITLMQEFGYSAEEAISLAQTGRQDPNVPVCDRQKEFVRNYVNGTI